MITLRKHTTSNGMPGLRVFAGAYCLGTIFHVDDADWQGVAPDGMRFSTTSKRKIIEMMRRHSMALKVPA